MASRRGFLGMLLSGAAATAGGVLLPSLGKSDSVSVAVTPNAARLITEIDNGGVVACTADDLDEEKLNDEKFGTRFMLYCAWRCAASEKMRAMSPQEFDEFIDAHVRVNAHYGIDRPFGTWAAENAYSGKY